MRIALAVFAFLIAALAAAFFVLRTPDTNRTAMIAKYGGSSPMFAEGPSGMKVHWRDEGCKSCPAIIFLHGTSASLHAWTPLVERLGVEYRIISYDQPGHGLTGPHPLGDYSASGMFQALNAVAAAAGLEHFILGGNSMGGWIAWRYALAYPERVDALILIDAGGTPLREGEAPPPLNLGFRLARNPLARPIVENFAPRSLVEQSLFDSVAVDSIVTPELVDRYWELLRFPGNRRAAAQTLTVDREMAYADRLREIAAPTLVIWGAEDRLVYPSAALTFDERIPNAEVLVLAGVGHVPMEEAPDETANAIRRFLDSLNPDAGDSLNLEVAQ